MNRSRPDGWIFCVAAWLLLSWQASHARAETTFQKLPDISHVKSTLLTPPVHKVMFGKLTVEFESTTLNEVAKAAGTGGIQHRGDAGDSKSYVCYSLGSNENVWFVSGELGGAKHAITSIHAARSPVPVDCPKLPSAMQPLFLNGLLWLGTDVVKLKKLLGTPSAVAGDWLIYSYEGVVPANGFDRISVLAIRASNGKVMDLIASQATTN